jgi:DNA-binding winged helix-turn-helix (wHTH) protein/tetratricopeptide (TPR) repeat protein
VHALVLPESPAGAGAGCFPMAVSADQKTRQLYAFGPFRVDPQKELLLRNNESIPLAPKAFQVLLVLMRGQKDVVTKDELLKAVWPDTFVEESNLSRNIFLLRKALGESPQDHQYIVTVPGRGYRFAGEVQFVPDAELNVVAASHPVAPFKKTSPWGWISVSIVLVIAAVVGALNLFVHRSPVLTSKDTVMLADFANSTGDHVFDGTLRQGLAIQLEQSPFLSLLSDQRIQRTLQLMGQPSDERLLPELAREICVRTGSAAILDGSIASFGSKYVIGVRARKCSSGELLDEEQVQVARKEDVLNGLTEIATKFRTQVGESLHSIKEHDTPLPEATTSSLEALKAFTLGDVQQIRNVEVLAALPFYLHAIELDPNFAIAYARLGAIYADLGQDEISRQYREEAFQRRDRTSEHERLYIVAHYYLDSSQFDKGFEAWELYRQTYPRDAIPLKNLAMGHLILGDFDKGLKNAQDAIAVDPDTGAQYLHAAWACLGLHRPEDAKAILNTALQRKVGGFGVHLMLAQVALVEHDNAALAREEALLKTGSLAEESLLYFEAMIAASRGQLKRSDELARQAMETSLRLQLKEAAARWLATQSRFEVEIGLGTKAIKDAHAALSMDSSPRVVSNAGLALALAHRDAEARSLIAQLEKRYPEDQFAQFVEVPEIRAALAMNHGDPVTALTYLERAKPFDRADPSARLERAGTMLRAGRLQDATSEFEVVSHFPFGASVAAVGSLWTCYTVNLFGPLANVGLARSRRLAGDISGSRRAYEEFLSAWKDADPNVPLLQQVRGEYAKLN